MSDSAFPILPSYLAQEHLRQMEAHFDSWPVTPTPAGVRYRKLLAHYFRLIIPAESSILEVGCGNGELLAQLPNSDLTGVDLSGVQLTAARQRLPQGQFFQQAGETLSLNRTFDYLILSETINQAADVQALFQNLHHVSTPRTRLVLNFYNTLWRPVLSLATRLGIRNPTPTENWLSRDDVQNLLELADWEVIKVQPRILYPNADSTLGNLLNRWIAPLLPWFCLTHFCIARPVPRRSETPFSVSVVVPARNESGNIDDIIRRTPELGSGTELILIEGNSTDDTWAKILETVPKYPDRKIVTMRQSGKGKGNAVRDAFAVATGDILMILDADLTVPPEELPKFYDVIASRNGEFANGVRLVYPMESKAMRFLNLCANKSFGLIFSWLLDQNLKDTLCGTKVLFRKDYELIARNRAYFGDFDPFGDFDLLFGADKLNLKIRDIPIRYRDRTYGETNIQRWRHGLLLYRMVIFAARKLKFI